MIFYLLKVYYLPGSKIDAPVKEALLVGLTVNIISDLINIPIMVFVFNMQLELGLFLQWEYLAGWLITFLAAYLAIVYMSKNYIKSKKVG